MREIKFRQPLFLNGKFHKFHYWGFLREDEFAGVVPPIDEAKKNSQEYTGLKDKDGKEIYEGDIIKEQVNQCVWFYLITTVGSLGNNLFAVTKWRNFTVVDGETIMGSYFEDGNWNYISSTCEVIGNIYENPELLKS